jgi:hypothetical protein
MKTSQASVKVNPDSGGNTICSKEHFHPCFAFKPRVKLACDFSHNFGLLTNVDANGGATAGIAAAIAAADAAFCRSGWKSDV